MAKLSPGELVALVRRHKFPDPATAVAVILGESGGDPRATNREPGNIDRGLWQISSRWHPDVSDSDAYDAERSTAHAFRISSGGTDFNAWHATRSANFAGHLRTAQEAVDAAGDDGGHWSGTDGNRAGGGSVGVGGIGRDVFGGGDTGIEPGDAGGAISDVVTAPLDALRAVGPLAGKVLGVLASADFWKRAGFVLAGVALLVLAVVALFGRDAAGAAIAAKTGGAIAPSTGGGA